MMSKLYNRMPSMRKVRAP